KRADQGLRLGQIGCKWIILGGSPGRSDRQVESVRNPLAVITAVIRQPVMDVEPCGDDRVGMVASNPSHDFTDEPGPVGDRAAVLAGPAAGGQQLVEQIAVTLLEVDEVESDP